MKSPLRYPGGKARLVKNILEYAPKEYSEYREPFLGGGSVLISLLEQNENIMAFKASDLFWELYNFWRQLKENKDNLAALVKSFRKVYTNSHNGHDLHSLCKKMFSDSRALSTNIDKAAGFFILNRISFSGLTLSGGYSRAAFETRFCDQHIERLNEVGTALNKRNIELTNNSYEYLLFLPPSSEKDNKSCWIYMDPPYDIGSKTLYGKNGDKHSGFDHTKFADDCKSSPYRWLISYNDNEYIRGLFSWANIHEIHGYHYNMNSKNKAASEILITNY